MIHVGVVILEMGGVIRGWRRLTGHGGGGGRERDGRDGCTWGPKEERASVWDGALIVLSF